MSTAQKPVASEDILGQKVSLQRSFVCPCANCMTSTIGVVGRVLCLHDVQLMSAKLL